MSRASEFNRFFRSHAELLALRTDFIDAIRRANADLLKQFGGV